MECRKPQENMGWNSDCCKVVLTMKEEVGLHKIHVELQNLVPRVPSHSGGELTSSERNHHHHCSNNFNSLVFQSLDDITVSRLFVECV